MSKFFTQCLTEKYNNIDAIVLKLFENFAVLFNYETCFYVTDTTEFNAFDYIGMLSAEFNFFDNISQNETIIKSNNIVNFETAGGHIVINSLGKNKSSLMLSKDETLISADIVKISEDIVKISFSYKLTDAVTGSVNIFLSISLYNLYFKQMCGFLNFEQHFKAMEEINFNLSNIFTESQHV